MVISNYNSWKIRSLSTILIIMVLFIHGYLLEAENYTFAGGLQRFFGSRGLSAAANRLFFVISGLLFFNNVNGVQDCLKKIIRRARTLLVPYIIWNCIFVLYYVVALCIPQLSSLVSTDLLSNFTNGVAQAFKYLFIAPANFPLWFLRDLIIMVIASPIIYYIIKKIKWFSLLLVVLVHCFVHVSSLLFFILGACLSMLSSFDRIDTICKNKAVASVSIIVYVFNAVLWFCGTDFNSLIGGGNLFYDSLITIVGVFAAFCSIVAVWVLFDCFNNLGLLKKIDKINGYSFFVYVFHMPVLAFIEKIVLLVLGKSEMSCVLIYLSSPVLLFAIAMVCAIIINRVSPKLYSVLVGGRK